MILIIRSLLAAALLLVGACSMESAINRLSSAEDRAFAQRFVDDVRRGDAEALVPQFEPGLWAQSKDRLVAARALYPAGQGATRLVGFRISVNSTNGVSTTTRQFVLVTGDGRHWTRTNIATLARGGPPMIVQWNVTGSDSPPPELQMFEKWERAVPWIQAGALLALLLLIGLVWWLIRCSTKRAVV